MRMEVEELARGMVVVRAREEKAWQVEMEWSDRYATQEDIDWRQLEHYETLFPESVSPIADLSSVVLTCSGVRINAGLV